MQQLPSRATLLVPVVILCLFATGLSASLTRADTLPEPCGLAYAADPATAAEADLLMLSAITSADLDLQQVDEAPRPTREGPTAPGRVRGPNAPVPPAPPTVTEPARPNQGPITPPSAVTSPKAPGTDLRVPEQAILNQEPIVAARQLRESLSDQQKADLQGVLTRHRERFQRVRDRLPEPATEARSRKPSNADQDARLQQATAELQGIGAQVDQEIEALLTPQQRALLQKARPKRQRSEMPALPPDALPLGISPTC